MSKKKNEKEETLEAFLEEILKMNKMLGKLSKRQQELIRVVESLQPDRVPDMRGGSPPRLPKKKRKRSTRPQLQN